MSKNINWAVREICKEYGHAPYSGPNSIAIILKELMEESQGLLEVLTEAQLLRNNPKSWPDQCE